MRVTITKTICNICGRENCDGKEYTIPARKHMGVHLDETTVCSSMLMKNKPGKRIYRSIAGHGVWFDYAFNEDGSFLREI